MQSPAKWPREFKRFNRWSSQKTSNKRRWKEDAEQRKSSAFFFCFPFFFAQTIRMLLKKKLSNTNGPSSIPTDPTPTTQTLRLTSHNLLNMSFASHTDDRLRRFELQRLMHRKNVCNPRDTYKGLGDANRCFQSFVLVCVYCCDEDLFFSFGQLEMLFVSSCLRCFVSN